MRVIENTQPVEKIDLRDDGSLEVHSIWNTIQGEGPHAGKPATFIRLSGCDLKCRRCDTDYTSVRDLMTVDEILDRIRNLPKRSLVVLTGGEPLRQNIAPLSLELLNVGKIVQVETNGTLLGCLGFKVWYDLLDSDVEIVCSPKTPKVNSELVEFWVNAWKYVVQAGRIDADGFPTCVLGEEMKVARPPKGSTAPIYIQPLDEGDPEKNAENIKAAVDCCMKHDRILSLQLHKLLGLE